MHRVDWEARERAVRESRLFYEDLREHVVHVLNAPRAPAWLVGVTRQRIQERRRRLREAGYGEALEAVRLAVLGRILDSLAEGEEGAILRLDHAELARKALDDAERTAFCG